MLTPVFVLFVAALATLLFRYLRAKADNRTLWCSTVWFGCSVGSARAMLACIGWYGLQHTGGPLQIPALALAVLALPEAVVFGRQRGAVSVQLYIALGLLLIASSLTLVSSVALAAQLARSWR